MIPPSYFTLDQVTAAVSVKRISQLSFDKLLLGHQDNPILENAQSVVQDAAKSIIHRLKQSQVDLRLTMHQNPIEEQD